MDPDPLDAALALELLDDAATPPMVAVPEVETPEAADDIDAPVLSRVDVPTADDPLESVPLPVLAEPYAPEGAAQNGAEN